MTRRPRDIGTAAESAVVRYARDHGFPGAERRALRGSADVGDILLCPGLIIEAKAGDAARKASDTLIHNWLEQTERERQNAGAEVALLVTTRAGIGAANAGRWFAHLRSDHHGGAPIRLTLADALVWLRSLGWGEPLDAPRSAVGQSRAEKTAAQVSQVPPAQSEGSTRHGGDAA